jgi:alanyl-tRNA synthetase
MNTMATTVRLYYDDASMRTFDASVVRAEARGDRAAVWLDRSAFYPTSGGQPFDIGTLGGAPVVDVEEDESGGVVHLVNGAVPSTGDTLHGEIDWRRRFDHMQQHTGQHLLSAVIEHAFKARTVSFHLGSESSTIDLDRELTAAQIARAELDANQVVWNDVPVTVRYASEEEARRLPLRKEPVRTGRLRLIDIEGVDLSACGGTHVDRTGALGQIAVASRERFKGGQRVEFLCGGRALARHQRLRDISAASTRLLSVLPQELASGIERLQADTKEQRRQIAGLQAELAVHEAASLASTAESLAIGRVVLCVVSGDAVRLKVLATAIAANQGVAAVLVSDSSPALAVAARAADVPMQCHEVIGALVREFGGRGGGKPDLAQCGGLQAAPEVVLAAARSILARG